jgi:hypothetical protein
VLDDLVDFWKDPSSSKSSGILTIRPPNFEIHDSDFVATRSHPLEKVVTLMRAFRDPVRLLENENSHGIEPGRECTKGT